jgi:lipopolysaccharide/colanic/teichoic acid biosynthesis glycosyltransferase
MCNTISLTCPKIVVILLAYVTSKCGSSFSYSIRLTFFLFHSSIILLFKQAYIQNSSKQTTKIDAHITQNMCNTISLACPKIVVILLAYVISKCGSSFFYSTRLTFFLFHSSIILLFKQAYTQNSSKHILFYSSKQTNKIDAHITQNMCNTISLACPKIVVILLAYITSKWFFFL